MTRIYCDICGLPLPDKMMFDVAVVISDIAGVEDTCERCGRIGGELDVKSIILDKWRAAASEQTDPEAAHNAAVKRECRDKLLEYRKTGGLGCLETLAARMGGGWNAEELRRLIGGELILDADRWKQVAAAIDALAKPKRGGRRKKTEG